MCCGQARQALRETQPQPSAVRGGSQIRYRESGSILIHGPVTGRRYQFSAGQPQSVDARDAIALLDTGFFDAGS